MNECSSYFLYHEFTFLPIVFQIKYKSFEKIDDEKKWWKIPIVTEFLEKHGFEPALKMIVGSETVQAREFVQFAFGQLKSINDYTFRMIGFPIAKLLVTLMSRKVKIKTLMKGPNQIIMQWKIFIVFHKEVKMGKIHGSFGRF